MSYFLSVPSAGTQEVTLNPVFLAPLSLDVDPKIQKLQVLETEQFKIFTKTIASVLFKVGVAIF